MAIYLDFEAPYDVTSVMGQARQTGDADEAIIYYGQSAADTRSHPRRPRGG